MPQHLPMLINDIYLAIRQCVSMISTCHLITATLVMVYVTSQLH